MKTPTRHQRVRSLTPSGRSAPQTPRTPAKHSGACSSRINKLAHLYCVRWDLDPTPAQLQVVQRHLGVVAIHEAGHALVAADLGIPFSSAELLPEEAPDLDGIVTVCTSTMETHPLNHAHMLIAGSAAEGLYTEDFDEAIKSSLTDWQSAVEAACLYYASLGSAWRGLTLAQVRVIQWLHRHWASVDAIATALLLHRRLSSATIRDIASRQGYYPDQRILPARVSCFLPQNRRSDPSRILG